MSLRERSSAYPEGPPQPPLPGSRLKPGPFVWKLQHFLLCLLPRPRPLLKPRPLRKPRPLLKPPPRQSQLSDNGVCLSRGTLSVTLPPRPAWDPERVKESPLPPQYLLHTWDTPPRRQLRIQAYKGLDAAW